MPRRSSRVFVMLPTAAAALFLFFSCTPPPLPNMEEMPASYKTAFRECCSEALAAFGSVRYTEKSEAHRGSVEAKRYGSGDFKAVFYASFGIEAGTVAVEGGAGTVTLDGSTYSLPSNRTLDTFPFEWGRDLTLNDFACILLGELPPSYTAEMARAPDTLIEDGRTISALWKTDTYEIAACIKRKGRKGAVLSVEFGKMPGRGFMFSDFKDGRARKITLSENDRNYFSVKYTKVINFQNDTR